VPYTLRIIFNHIVDKYVRLQQWPYCKIKADKFIWYFRYCGRPSPV
jgi:hypothetical protein